MKQFFKDNIYQSVVMMVNQLAMTMFGVMLIFAVSVAGDKTAAGNTVNELLLAGVSVLSVVFYLSLLYHMSYELGQKDGIRIQGGRMSYFRWKGFFISLIANIPNLLLGLLELIGKIAINGDSVFADISRMQDASPVWATNLFSICHTIARFIQGMYIGIGKVWFENVGFFDLLIPIPAILICTFAYQWGVRYCDGFIKRSPKESKKAKDVRYK